MKRKINLRLTALLATTFAHSYAHADDLFNLSLEELAVVNVVSSSRLEQPLDEAFSNISVITRQMIERRGYRNIIQALEDLPGFDFATYEDGGGEYPTHMLNRGIGGDNGNTRMLVMVDGIVQNHIAFNWAQGLTDEQIMIDIERIEVVQGPGSALYGTNAVSGIVHIITRKNVEGTQAKLLVGEDNTRGVELLHGGKISEDLSWQLAFKGFLTDGDGGEGRPDPGGYFSGNTYPDTLLANYDAAGVYQTNVPNPRAGQAIPDGFNTSKEDKAVRLKAYSDSTEMGITYWERLDGLGSYVPGYEYDATADDFVSHQSSMAIYSKHIEKLSNDKVIWRSDFRYRVDRQEPDTGFRYNYRFADLKKSYHSKNSQFEMEQQLNWKQDDKDIVVGLNYKESRKVDQVVSLGSTQNVVDSSTDSSWEIAAAGNGLSQAQLYNTRSETEIALFGLVEGRLTTKLGYSIGGRYSERSEYNSAFNPRAGLIYQFENNWIVKGLYSTAFRQPTLFELEDEFRGNSDLEPETIDTLEFVVSKRFNKSSFKANVFYSKLSDAITLVGTPSRYQNIDGTHVGGFSSQWDMNVTDGLAINGNYSYLQGKSPGDSGWGEVDHAAEHKLNAGIDWQPLGESFNVNLQGNFVGKRKTPDTNRYFDGHAPGYARFDLVLSLKDLFDKKGLLAQLTVNNLLDKDYYGVGRQSGDSLSSEYDPATNPNPSGFIPAYHPQPGRALYLTLAYQF